jgi:hypothetical protein
MTELMRHVGNKRPAVKRAIEATVRFTLRWALKTIPEVRCVLHLGPVSTGLNTA